MAKIARTQGFSRARVTQIMNLLRLPERNYSGARPQRART
jgi:hypothetical protein